jgi:hypothetical protein
MCLRWDCTKGKCRDRSTGHTHDFCSLKCAQLDAYGNGRREFGQCRGNECCLSWCKRRAWGMQKCCSALHAVFCDILARRGIEIAGWPRCSDCGRPVLVSHNGQPNTVCQVHYRSVRSEDLQSTLQHIAAGADHRAARAVDENSRMPPSTDAVARRRRQIEATNHIGLCGWRGCRRPRYVDMAGVRHRYCGNMHAVLAEAKPHSDWFVCLKSNCTKAVARKSDGTNLKHRFCSWAHAKAAGVTAEEWMSTTSTRQARIPHELGGRTSGLQAYTRPPSIVKEKANGEDSIHCSASV